MQTTAARTTRRRSTFFGLATLAALGLAIQHPAQAQTDILSGETAAQQATAGFQATTSPITGAGTVTGTSVLFTDGSGNTSSSGATTVATYGAYHAPAGSSVYIAPSGYAPISSTTNALAGDYFYQTTFTLGSDQSPFSLGGTVYSDNALTGAYIDGDTSKTIAFTALPMGGSSYGTGYTLSSSYFQYGTGTHVLDLVVHNDATGGLPNLTAVDFALHATPAPEPSSVAAFALTGLGAAGLMLRARKRRTVVTS